MRHDDSKMVHSFVQTGQNDASYFGAGWNSRNCKQQVKSLNSGKKRETLFECIPFFKRGCVFESRVMGRFKLVVGTKFDALTEGRTDVEAIANGADLAVWQCASLLVVSVITNSEQ